ncbi:pirin family protein [Lacihabitans sp. LS3-19]|uniref:pirin family protein n=1 Tax=Lacihabitans sp. LS3-19 TaxID=2487335 RepID=UPI0020CE30B9|nr:pirin family protein [Lacihabitans sp. LS3-19]MCP9770304.1 pirin family protein [Lacihabitans sp. LS3-19]
MKTIYHASDSRGKANHGWLNSFHTFSFANYYDPERVNFGALRVLNDDTVSGGMGFGKHPHDNMEIVSIPLDGALEHQDSMGNKAIIKKGEVQLMSAGTGVTHSEKNFDLKNTVKFLQIWIMPEKRNIQPRYEQEVFEAEGRKNAIQTVISPIGSNDGGLKINQKAWFSLVDLSGEIKYDLKDKSNGVYVFVLEGDVEVENQKLNRRDGFGVWEIGTLNLKTDTSAEILLMEVPMKF